MIGLLRSGSPPFQLDRAGYLQSFFARLIVKFNDPCRIKQFGEGAQCLQGRQAAGSRVWDGMTCDGPPHDVAVHVPVGHVNHGRSSCRDSISRQAVASWCVNHYSEAPVVHESCERPHALRCGSMSTLSPRRLYSADHPHRLPRLSRWTCFSAYENVGLMAGCSAGSAGSCRRNHGDAPHLHPGHSPRRHTASPHPIRSRGHALGSPPAWAGDRASYTQGRMASGARLSSSPQRVFDRA
jgi:hypothetical protein